MPEQLIFAMEVTLNGLLNGVMYALVALGFVLIFKASGIFNYAQGVMALFAAMTLVGIQQGRVPFGHLINEIFGTDIHYFGWEVPALAAILLTVLVMIAFAYLVQRFVFRHLVGQEPIILFMATIGLAYFLEGVSDLMWGSEIRNLDVGLPQGINDAIDQTTFEVFGYGFFIDNLDISAAVIAAILVAGLIAFAQYTKQGRAMRAVADDHQAALSVGIKLNYVWVLVWSLAGMVALVAGIMWGAKSGVQFSLSLIALKALPVLMLGGFTSIPGAIVGGLIIGVGEKLFEFYIGPDDRGRDGELVRLCAGAGVPRLQAAGPVRREDHREGVRAVAHPIEYQSSSWRPRLPRTTRLSSIAFMASATDVMATSSGTSAKATRPNTPKKAAVEIPRSEPMKARTMVTTMSMIAPGIDWGAAEVNCDVSACAMNATSNEFVTARLTMIVVIVWRELRPLRRLSENTYACRHSVAYWPSRAGEIEMSTAGLGELAAGRMRRTPVHGPGQRAKAEYRPTRVCQGQGIGAQHQRAQDVGDRDHHRFCAFLVLGSVRCSEFVRTSRRRTGAHRCWRSSVLAVGLYARRKVDADLSISINRHATCGAMQVEAVASLACPDPSGRAC
jgi:branched-chain amino acid transport system permease protein